MGMASEGVNGKAVAITLTGAILMYSGLKGKHISETVRGLISGDLGNPNAPDSKIHSAGFTTGRVSKGKLVRLGRSQAEAFHWNKGDQWHALNMLWTQESNWDNTAQNDHSTAYGIAQFLDSTWKGTGYKKTSDPLIQIEAGLVYIHNTYGSPVAAWAHEQQYGWY